MHYAVPPSSLFGFAETPVRHPRIRMLLALLAGGAFRVNVTQRAFLVAACPLFGRRGAFTGTVQLCREFDLDLRELIAALILLPTDFLQTGVGRRPARSSDETVARPLDEDLAAQPRSAAYVCCTTLARWTGPSSSR
jgi:hypothetical protein